jgi:hypothetical protein
MTCKQRHHLQPGQNSTLETGLSKVSNAYRQKQFKSIKTIAFNFRLWHELLDITICVPNLFFFLSVVSTEQYITHTRYGIEMDTFPAEMSSLTWMEVLGIGDQTLARVTMEPRGSYLGSSHPSPRSLPRHHLKWRARLASDSVESTWLGCA